jgi:hypothetical protein
MRGIQTGVATRLEGPGEAPKRFRQTQFGRRIMAPLAFCRRLSERLTGLLRRSRLEIWRVEGKERTTQLPLTLMICASRAQENRFILELIFGESFQEHSLGRLWFWKIPGIIPVAGKECALVLINVPRGYLGRLPLKNYFFIPNWVLGEIDIPLDPELFRKNHTIRNDLRKIQKHGLSFEVTRDPLRFDDFYYNMHVPFICKSHGNSVHVTAYEEMREKLPQCDLLLLNQREQQHVAGLLILYGESVPRLWTAGIRDANPEYLRNGAIPALYHFSFGHLLAQGFTSVSPGFSRPFLHDGVLEYKRKFGQRIANYAPAGYCVKLLSQTPGAKAFLENNPFIFEEGGLLYGAVFRDGTAALDHEQLKQVQKDCFHPGMSKLVIYRFGKSSIGSDCIPPEFAGQMLLRTISEESGILSPSPVNHG